MLTRSQLVVYSWGWAGPKTEIADFALWKIAGFAFVCVCVQCTVVANPRQAFHFSPDFHFRLPRQSTLDFLQLAVHLLHLFEVYLGHLVPLRRELSVRTARWHVHQLLCHDHPWEQLLLHRLPCSLSYCRLCRNRTICL